MLGKGAFGEVYYGLLADVARLQSSLPVAVKVCIGINNTRIIFSIEMFMYDFKQMCLQFREYCYCAPYYNKR